MSRRPLLIVLAALSLLMIMLVSPVYGWAGGGGNNNYQYGDCSCHNVESSASIDMTASSNELAPGDEVTVTVTVSGGVEANNPLGVMLLSKLGSNVGTTPDENGWKIISDTYGGTNNYNEVPSYQGSANFKWTLQAPQEAGSYSLFAKLESSSGSSYFTKDFKAGLGFTVSESAGSGSSDSTSCTSSEDATATISVMSPASGATVDGNVTVKANINSSCGQTIALAELSIDGSPVAAKSKSPYLWTVDTKDLDDGAHLLNVTAVTSAGQMSAKELVITVVHASTDYIAKTAWAPTDIMFITVIGVFVIIGINEIRLRSK